MPKHEFEPLDKKNWLKILDNIVFAYVDNGPDNGSSIETFDGNLDVIDINNNFEKRIQLEVKKAFYFFDKYRHNLELLQKEKPDLFHKWKNYYGKSHHSLYGVMNTAYPYTDWLLHNSFPIVFNTCEKCGDTLVEHPTTPGSDGTDGYNLVCETCGGQ